MKKKVVYIVLGFLLSTSFLRAEGELLLEASNTLQTIMRSRNIPNVLLDRVVAVAVFPSVKQGGFFVGGLYGQGLFTVRSASEDWGEPMSVQISGGNIGYQLGYQASDILFLILNSSVANDMLKNKTTLGIDASIALGPFGKNFSSMTDIKLTEDIYIYSNNRGLFAGASLGGAYFEVNNEPVVAQTEYALNRWKSALMMIGGM